MTNLRIGNGYDIHALGEGLPLVLGGVKIPHTKGCIAHSDGDVLLHALCDALLGALALGDIGQHFPDTSEEFRGIDSRLLLERVVAMVHQAGWRVVNADMTLLAQKPKIAPYVPQMRETIAPLLGVGTDCVSVKATTTEKLGPIGREEGISAYAVVLLGR
ncbi:MAG: 2-C-methyl-D-erythritol 2,4-cyclodiphosphate synthase [Bacteroidales bacterium]|nr:2-C-methyl-D-erythritol 2,4-cyclodiphosphate synthase [Bacteroidales bacterium]